MADEVPEDETITLLRQIKENSERTRTYAGLIAFLCIGICGGIAIFIVLLTSEGDPLLSLFFQVILCLWTLFGLVIGCGILVGDKKKELQEEKEKQS